MRPSVHPSERPESDLRDGGTDGSDTHMQWDPGIVPVLSELQNFHFRLNKATFSLIFCPFFLNLTISP